MSISNTTRKTAIMNGNGTSVLFPFAFRINDEEDLKVYVKIGLGPFELKELETDYKLSNVVRDSNNNIISGNIEYPIIIAGEPNQPSPLTSADSIYGIRETPRNQEESSEQVSFKSKDVERALDKATMQIQELTEDVSRAIKVEEWQDIDPDDIIDSIFEAEGECANYALSAALSADNAEAYKNSASQHSTNASKWAEGTDSEVSDLGGTHSAKGWANVASGNASAAESAAQECLVYTQEAINSLNRPLLSFIWSDHKIDNEAWLMADTFSWQDGTVYTRVYNHLKDEFDNIPTRTFYGWMSGNPLDSNNYYTLSDTPQAGDIIYKGTDPTGFPPHYTKGEFHSVVASFSGGVLTDVSSGTYLSNGSSDTPQLIAPDIETVGSHVIAYYKASDDHKIVLPDQETTVANIYSESGISWYFVLDTANTRFKLPRTKYNFVGFRDTVGNYVPESLPDHRHKIADQSGTNGGNYNDNSNYMAAGLATNTQGEKYSYGVYDNSTYQNNAPVQQRATQMYLYFYVGNFTETATQQTAGLNSELFNGKLDRDFSNKPSNIHYVIETYSDGTDWYRVWSDGWCEQGGKLVINTSNVGGGTYNTASLTFLKPFTKLCSYYCQAKHDRFNAGFASDVIGQSASSVEVYQVNDSSSSFANPYVVWKAEGYIS